MADRRRTRPSFANAWFFPGAAVYGAFSISAWVMAWTGYIDCLPGLCTPTGHAHEMLFGYALAVVAGFLLGPQPILVTVALFLLWLGARVAFIGWPGSWPAVILVAVFALGVALKVIPRFAHSAKKWRNRSLVWIVAGLVTASVIATLRYADRPMVDGAHMASLTLLAALMFFMGGRIIAPAVGGYITRQGGHLDARVQPALEGGVLLSLLGALVGTAAGSTFPVRFTGTMLVVAAILAAIRLARWQLWLCGRRPDLLLLALGYGWLVVGIGLLGLASFGILPRPVAVHSLTIGALGTLTIVVMARTRLLYRFRDANVAPLAHFAALLMSGSALARIAWSGNIAPFGVDLLLVSGGLWALSCLLLLFPLLATLRTQASPV
ncbi:MAG: NnrS family protein [Pseudomonadales bacterium]|nr:NnrS family protein [Pseudomonadales bacterium]